MTDLNVVMQCPHCGQLATFALRAEYTYTNIISRDISGALLESASTTWAIMQCLTCEEPTITETIKVFKSNQLLDNSETKMLYPRADTPKRLTNLPEAIEKEYEDTLKVLTISPIAAAVLARRTLEAIFIHENAYGKTLIDKVNSLLKSDRIPPLLGDMAHLGRQIGNLGAHFTQDTQGKVTKEDVAVMLDFVETILEYLYVAPAKVAEVKERLNKTP